MPAASRARADFLPRRRSWPGTPSRRCCRSTSALEAVEHVVGGDRTRTGRATGPTCRAPRTGPRRRPDRRRRTIRGRSRIGARASWRAASKSVRSSSSRVWAPRRIGRAGGRSAAGGTSRRRCVVGHRDLGGEDEGRRPLAGRGDGPSPASREARASPRGSAAAPCPRARRPWRAAWRRGDRPLAGEERVAAAARDRRRAAPRRRERPPTPLAA